MNTLHTSVAKVRKKYIHMNKGHEKKNGTGESKGGGGLRKGDLMRCVRERKREKERENKSGCSDGNGRSSE